MGSCPFCTTPRAGSSAWSTVLTVVLLLIPSRLAHAQPWRWGLRSTANLALMVSSDQVRRLKYERPGVIGALYGSYEAQRAVELRAGVLGGPFFAAQRLRAGGLLGGTLGGRLHLPDRKLRPYLALDVGAGFTGEYVRPLLVATAGVDIAVGKRAAIGPALSYLRVFQWNGPGYSSDATSLMVGASLAIALDLRPAPHAPPPVTPAEPDHDVLVLIERALPTPTRTELLAPVLFAFDSDALEPIGIAMLHETAATLAARREIELLEIRGYADERGDPEYNAALSLRRAQRVHDWLIEHGVEPERLVVAGRGESEFVESGDDERRHLQNRRVVFRVLREKTHASE